MSARRLAAQAQFVHQQQRTRQAKTSSRRNQCAGRIPYANVCSFSFRKTLNPKRIPAGKRTCTLLPPFHRSFRAEIGLHGILAAQPFHAHHISIDLSKESKIALVAAKQLAVSLSYRGPRMPARAARGHFPPPRAERCADAKDSGVSRLLRPSSQAGGQNPPREPTERADQGHRS